MNTKALVLVSFFMSLQTLFCATPVFADAEKALAAYAAALANPFDDDAFQKYLDTLPRIPAPFGQGDKLYLIEGDIPRTAKGVRNDLIAKGSAPRPAASQERHKPELIVHVEQGQPTVWAKGKRTLRYAVVRSTFASEADYKRVVEDMKAAAADWKAACTECDIELVHESAHDAITTMQQFEDLTSTDKIRFAVILSNSGGEFIAAAFFPHEPARARFVQIDPSYFNLRNAPSGRGVLRHELGHVFGYRHEHTRGVPGCRFEDNQWKPLTPYDPHSVMHYFCGGGGDLNLDITQVDKDGHKSVYKAQ